MFSELLTLTGTATRPCRVRTMLGMAALLTACACRHRQEDAAGAAMQRPPSLVTVAPAVVQEVPVYLDAIGRTLSTEIVSIVPQVGGKIIAAHVEDGAYVEKGQLLFEIDPRPFTAALASAKATLSQSKAERDWARVELNRVERLLTRVAATEFELEQKRVGLSVAEARIEAAEAAVEAAQLNVEYSNIYSPITGRAGARLVHPGNVVQPNVTGLLVVQQLDPIYVEFTVNENDLNRVRRQLTGGGLEMESVASGLEVEVTLPSSHARPRWAPEAAGTRSASMPSEAGGFGEPAGLPATSPAAGASAERRGSLTFLDNSVQAGAGTIRMRATVPNSDQYFWPGQFVNVRLILEKRPNAVLIPAQAQQVGQQGAFVYVVNPGDQTAQLRPIQPGQRHGSMIVVTSGVSAGEKVIVTGQNMVMPGAVVTVTNEGPGPGAPPGPSQHASASMKH